MMKNISIKEIKSEDTWGIRHRVMWPDHKIDFVKLEEDTKGIHYGLFIKDSLTSIVSVFIDKDKAQFRKFATETEHQGKGLGTKLLTYMLEELNKIGVSKIWCNARVDKTSYYHRFNLKETDKTYIKGGIDFVIMKNF